MPLELIRGSGAACRVANVVAALGLARLDFFRRGPLRAPLIKHVLGNLRVLKLLVFSRDKPASRSRRESVERAGTQPIQPSVSAARTGKSLEYVAVERPAVVQALGGHAGQHIEKAEDGVYPVAEVQRIVL